MRIYTDENVDPRVAQGLRRRGVHAASAHEAGELGATDEAQFEEAISLEAAIFIHDRHFVEIAVEKTLHGKEHFGVIFAEMHRLSLGECIRRLALCADVLTAEEVKNRVEFL